MKHKFVFATNNAHKLEEVTAILGNRIELLSLKDFGRKRFTESTVHL